MVDSSPRETDSRLIRVFLSSTFRDFMEERDLLVKQVFPELRRKARERGVEVVEVDLRWGITEEESRQGKVLPICLAEINRCRPYFVGMLGERYGWVPPEDDDNRVVLADEEYAWVEEHLGRRSVTELEILHGVLNNPEMAGRAFFYFRDSAWSKAQKEPGFVCDNDEEQQKLDDLKQRIRDSRFPVVEDLPDPEALANRIGADLWALIEEQYPELDQPDALEREERKHASYRRARTELYEDGGTAGVKVSQLEQWIASGEQRILITGDSGAGKSALIANWMQRHQQSHPDDVVFAHHLGCSNDANALEPMLARMVQTASKLMADESDGGFSEPIKVPQDYWELVSTVTDTLSKLSFWCKQRGRRWIWVLDGLDRLPEENQQALPWLPLQLFPHLHVVISALDCQARTILQERQYTTLTIGPLQEVEQKALIASTMRRYNKTLIPELEAKILQHDPACSPLYLRVVLDELRVCGRHETLDQQLDDYLKAESVDALYAKVLERLELDVGREPVQKVMTALWASRAGLSETELLGITKVTPLQWAPIDLGLEGSFGRNGERLVFDHDYLRQAVKKRYLPTEEAGQKAHSELADWFGAKKEWDLGKAYELPWQLALLGRESGVRDLLLNPYDLYSLCCYIDDGEILEHWRNARLTGDGELDVAISDATLKAVESWSKTEKELISFVDTLGHLLYVGGYFRPLLLRLREWSLNLEQKLGREDAKGILISKANLGNMYGELGMWEKSIRLLQECADECILTHGIDSLQRIQCLRSLLLAFKGKGDFRKAEEVCEELLLLARDKYTGPHPELIECNLQLAGLKWATGAVDEAYVIYTAELENALLLHGQESQEVFDINNLLISVLYAKKDNQKAKEIIENQLIMLRAKKAGDEAHAYLLQLRGAIYYNELDYAEAELSWLEELSLYEALQDEDSPDKINALNNIGTLYHESGNHNQALDTRRRQLGMAQRLLGKAHPDSLIAAINFAHLLSEMGEWRRSALMLKSIRKTFATFEDAYSELHFRCLRILARALSEQRRYSESIPLRRELLCLLREQKGDMDRDTLSSLNSLAVDLRQTGQLQEAEALFRELVTARQQVLEPNDFQIGRALGGLAKTLEMAGKFDEALIYAQQALEHRQQYEGPDTWWTNRERLDLAKIYQKLERPDQAIALLGELQTSMAGMKDLDLANQELLAEAVELRLSILPDENSAYG